MTMTETTRTGPPIAVRPAIHDDLLGLQAVAERTWRATYAGQLPEADIEAFLAAHYAPERLAQRLGPGLFVATRDAAVIGYAQAGLNGEGHAELFAIYVLPEMQGFGAGSQLWRRALARAHELGQRDMLVWVLATNAVARRFYERQSARVVGERAFSVGGGSVIEVGYRAALA